MICPTSSQFISEFAFCKLVGIFWISVGNGRRRMLLPIGMPFTALMEKIEKITTIEMFILLTLGRNWDEEFYSFKKWRKNEWIFLKNANSCPSVVLVFLIKFFSFSKYFNKLRHAMMKLETHSLVPLSKCNSWALRI